MNLIQRNRLGFAMAMPTILTRPDRKLQQPIFCLTDFDDSRMRHEVWLSKISSLRFHEGKTPFWRPEENQM